jgi:hypothetical protein
MYRSLPERTYPPRWRVAVAFLFIPALAALSVALAMPLYAGLPTMTERVWRSTLVYGLVGAYPPALVLGVPAYFMLRRHFEPRLISCALAAPIVAALPWLFLTLVSAPDQASIGDHATIINGSFTAYGWLMNAQFVGGIGLAGAAGGALFWAIAAAGRGVGKHRF